MRAKYEDLELNVVVFEDVVLMNTGVVPSTEIDNNDGGSGDDLDFEG